MNRCVVSLCSLLMCIPCWAETAAPEPPYKQPFPHSSGADLLPYCEQTDLVVSQLRCDYYVQGVADLATIPQEGKRLACIPQGQNRTQLMQIAVSSLKAAKPDILKSESAASLILNAFVVAFPCAAGDAVQAVKAVETPAVSAEMTEAIVKALLEAQKKEAAKAAD